MFQWIALCVVLMMTTLSGYAAGPAPKVVDPVALTGSPEPEPSAPGEEAGMGYDADDEDQDDDDDSDDEDSD